MVVGLLEESCAAEPLRVLKGGCNSKMDGIHVRQHKAANGGKSLQEQARMSREFQKWRCWCGVGCMHARAEIELRMHEILAHVAAAFDGLHAIRPVNYIASHVKLKVSRFDICAESMF